MLAHFRSLYSYRFSLRILNCLKAVSAVSFFNFSSVVTKPAVRQFLKLSIVLPAMNESVNESKHKNIKERINIKFTKDLPKTALFISLKNSFPISFFHSCMLTSVEVDVVFQPWRLIKQ